MSHSCWPSCWLSLVSMRSPTLAITCRTRRSRPDRSRSYRQLRSHRAPRGINTWGDPVSRIDPQGLAYFGVRPLQGLPWLEPLSNNRVDNVMNTTIAHEQLFFEDGQAPGHMGFFGDSKLKTESVLDGYRELPRRYNDCVMRIAMRSADTGRHSLTTNNCQSWADRVREQYNKLIRFRATAAACGL